MDKALDKSISSLLDRRQTPSSHASGSSVWKKQPRFQITGRVASLLSPVLQKNARADSHRDQQLCDSKET